MPSQIHVGDVGTEFNITLTNSQGQAIDMSSVSATIVFVFQKPDGSRINRLGSLVGDGSSGIVTYNTISNDLDQYGIWRLQISVDVCNKILSSEIIKFKVLQNLNCS